MSSVKFPYLRYEDIGVPVIPIKIKVEKWHEIWGFVDTGATYTTLHSEEADRLGLNYLDGERVMVTVGDGGSIPVYLHDLKVKIGTHEFGSIIGFSDRLGVDLNIIGRKNLFEEFVVCFDDKNELLTFKNL